MIIESHQTKTKELNQKTLTQRKVLELLKKEIKEAGYPFKEDRRTSNDSLYGTMYLKKKMDYGFHVYYIFEPDPDSEIRGKEYGVLVEMYYDLRHRIYWIKRNNKEVQFSIRNIDSIFPSFDRLGTFDFLSTEGNVDLYYKCYNMLGSMDKERSDMVGRFLYRLMTEYPFYEILHKAGVDLNNLPKQINTNGKSPQEILGLNQSQWKMHKKYRVKPQDFIDYARNKENLNQKDSKFANLLSVVADLNDKYGLNKTKDFIDREMEFIYTGKERYYTSTLDLAKKWNIPEKKMIEYIYYQCDVEQAIETPHEAARLYADYRRMSENMGDIYVDKYPKTLELKHDIVARNYKINLTPEEKIVWDQRYEENKQFEWKYRDYLIFAPKEVRDLQKEGNAQANCVASYIHPHLNNNCTILFLRTKENSEESLITLEIRRNKIVQAKKKFNHEPDREHLKILERFADNKNLSFYWRRITPQPKVEKEIQNVTK